MKNITEKWQLTGLLEGLTNEQQEIMALGLENQGLWCMRNGFENSALLIPVARSLMLKIMDSLATVPVPAFLSKEERPMTVGTSFYGQRITTEDLASLSPVFVEKLATSMANKLLADKKDNSTIYLYTPIILYAMASDLSHEIGYRAAFG